MLTSESLEYYLSYENPQYKEWIDESELKFHNWLNESGIRYCPDNIEDRLKIIYPNLEDNEFLYHLLTKTSWLKNTFDPLQFFNLLYEQLEIAFIETSYIEKEDFVPSVYKLDIEKKQFYFLIFSLHYIIYRLNSSPPFPSYLDGIERTWKSTNLAFFAHKFYKSYKELERDLPYHLKSPYDTEVSKLIYKLKQKIGLNVADEKVIKENKKLSYRQLVYKIIYEGGRVINVNNGNEIAKTYGFLAKSAGQKIYQTYLIYSKNVNRLAFPDPCSDTALIRKIKFIESLINHLNENGKIQANDEIKRFQAKIKNNNQL